MEMQHLNGLTEVITLREAVRLSGFTVEVPSSLAGQLVAAKMYSCENTHCGGRALVGWTLVGEGKTVGHATNYKYRYPLNGAAFIVDQDGQGTLKISISC